MVKAELELGLRWRLAGHEEADVGNVEKRKRRDRLQQVKRATHQHGVYWQLRLGENCLRRSKY